MQSYSNKYKDALAKAFIDCLSEKGLNWKKGWSEDSSVPKNATTQAPYSGANNLILRLTSSIKGYKDQRWCTFLQAKENGWHIREDAPSQVIEFHFVYDTKEKVSIPWDEFNQMEKNAETLKNFKILTKTYYVFNAEEIDGIPPYIPEAVSNKIEADKLISDLSKNMNVPILNDGGDSAYYSTVNDTIHLPEKSSFYTSYEYNATALHELAHATGAEHRLNRISQEYAYEELIAEISSCFMSANLDLAQTDKHIENHKTYVQSWIQSIKEKPETLLKAISEAQKVTAYMEQYSQPALENEIDISKKASAKAPLKSTVYVCSPLAGEIESNIRKAREYSRFVAKEGNIPIAPHITELFDDKIPEERELGLSLGIDYLRKADEIWVFGDKISRGMAAEIKIAHDELKIPIFSVNEDMLVKHEFNYNLFLENQKTGKVNNQMPENRFVSKEQKEMAKNVDLLQYVSLRYTVQRHSQNSFKIIENGHDSVVLFPETNTWFDYANAVGGDTISFLVKHEGKNFTGAVRELLGETYNVNFAPHQVSSVPKKHTAMKLPPHDANNQRVFAYLVKTRSIDREIVKECIDNGSVFQSCEEIHKGDQDFLFSNCIFVGFNEEGIPAYASKRSMNSDTKYSMKSDVINSNKEYGFVYSRSNSPKWLTVCEAPIDALSIASLNKIENSQADDQAILSLGGVTDKALAKYLELHPSVEVIDIALDNDAAGRTAGEKIKEKYSQSGYKIVERYPTEKDYNEQLKKEVSALNTSQMDLPDKTANANRTLDYLASTRGIDKDIVKSMIDNNQLYQSDRDIIRDGMQKKISSSVFAAFDEKGFTRYAIEIKHNYTNGKADFKIEYKDSRQPRNFLDTKGTGDSLLVFNNPISMLSHQTMYKESGKDNPNHYLCCIGGHGKAVNQYLSDNPNISKVKIMLDESLGYDKNTCQLVDFRETAFNSIKKTLKEKNVEITKKYPNGIDWNSDMLQLKNRAKFHEKMNLSKDESFQKKPDVCEKDM